MKLPPLLLLDVDGVLNALADYDEHLPVWSVWETGRAETDGTSWLITWAPAVVDQLLAWHEAGHVEIQWRTTWGHDANGELRQLLGMPELAVAGTYDDQDLTPAADLPATSHARCCRGTRPLTGRWRKYESSRRCCATSPNATSSGKTTRCTTARATSDSWPSNKNASWASDRIQVQG